MYVCIRINDISLVVASYMIKLHTYIILLHNFLTLYIARDHCDHRTIVHTSTSSPNVVCSRLCTFWIFEFFDELNLYWKISSLNWNCYSIYFSYYFLWPLIVNNLQIYNNVHRMFWHMLRRRRWRKKF